jgi:hypothetical protein
MGLFLVHLARLPILQMWRFIGRLPIEGNRYHFGKAGKHLSEVFAARGRYPIIAGRINKNSGIQQHRALPFERRRYLPCDGVFLCSTFA